MHSQSPLLTLPSLPPLIEPPDWLTLLCDAPDTVGDSLVGGSLVGGSLVGGCEDGGIGTGLVESPGLSDVGGVTSLDGPSVDDVIVAEPELGWPDGGVAPLLSNADVGDVLGADGPVLLAGGVDG